MLDKEEIVALDEIWSRKMREVAAGLDEEENHIKGDDILLSLLNLIGFRKTCEAFKDMPKYYA